MIRLRALILSTLAGIAAAQPEALRDAARALGRGDYSTAEIGLRAVLTAHPSDGWALSLLGLALDQQKRFAEAEQAHRKAIEIMPRSADVLNNYGNHHAFPRLNDGGTAGAAGQNRCAGF